MCGRYACLAFVGGLLAVIAYVAVLVDLPKAIPAPTATGCSVVGHETGLAGEDMTLLDEGRVLIGMGDFETAMKYGKPEVAKDGGVYLLDLRGSEAVLSQVPMEGVPGNIKLVFHGLFFSNATERLYLVNHGFSGGGDERVVVFKVATTPTVKLTYENSVTSPLFLPGVLNDVVEGGSIGEIYVTNWLLFPMPAKGRAHGSLLDTVGAILQKIVPGFWHATSVLRCTFKPGSEDAADCTVAASGFAGCNGLTTTPDRTRLLVVDPAPKRVLVLARDSTTGQLAPRSAVSLTHSVDNVEMDAATGKVYAGTIPSVHRTLRFLDKHDVEVPGGMTVLTPVEGGGYSYTASDVAFTDPKLFIGTSASLVTRGKAVYGSFAGPGVLVCNEA